MQFDRLFESEAECEAECEAESEAECEGYFTVVNKLSEISFSFAKREMLSSFCTNFILIFHVCLRLLLSASRSFQATIPSYRICKPGPALGYPVDSTRKNCLIIGDSVSIG